MYCRHTYTYLVILVIDVCLQKMEDIFWCKLLDLDVELGTIIWSLNFLGFCHFRPFVV